MDQLPPNDINLEKAVLGAILLESDAVAEVDQTLKPQMFYKESHQLIYETILNLDQNNQAIDLLTVTDALRKRGVLEKVGGPSVVTELTNSVGSSANIERHAQSISEKWILRELHREGLTISQEAINGTTDPFDLINKTDKRISEIQEGLSGQNYQTMSSAVAKTMKHIEERANQENTLIGLPCGNTELDRLLHGFVPGRLIVCGARPGMGKTTKMSSWAYNIAVNFDMPVAIFSLEMSTEELTMRFISSTTGIDHYQVINGDLEPNELQDINRRIGNLETDNLIIEDTPKLTTYDIRSISRRLIKTHGIKGIFIDYLQIMGDRNPDNTLYKKNTDNVANCKAIAKELNIPVILFSQLSRSVENRVIKRPMLSDLRESGAIEENSDQVLFLYRPEYYGILEDEEGKPTEGATETIIGKNRHGSLGTVTEKANFDTFSFTDAPF